MTVTDESQAAQGKAAAIRCLQQHRCESFKQCFFIKQGKDEREPKDESADERLRRRAYERGCQRLKKRIEGRSPSSACFSSLLFYFGVPLPVSETTHLSVRSSDL